MDTNRKRTAARGTGQLPASYKTSRPGLHGDGGNLYLQVSDGPHGRRRSWVFRFQLKGGRRRDMGLGSLDTVSLKEARETARQYRVLVRDGIDPIADRNAKVAKNLAANVAVMTFQEAAEIYVKQHRSTWKNPVHAKQWITTLQTYVYPVLGKMAVADIETPHVMRVLNPIGTTRPTPRSACAADRGGARLRRPPTVTATTRTGTPDRTRHAGAAIWTSCSPPPAR